MGEKMDVWQGTLALMILKTVESMGPLHGYGIARRIDPGNRPIDIARGGKLIEEIMV